MERQVDKECYAQTSAVIKYLTESHKLRLDSNRHYHMVLVVMRGVCKVTKRINRNTVYIRLSMEKVSRYHEEPALWSRISPLSIVMAQVLNT